MTQFSDRVKKARKDAGLSQAELAHRCGMAQGTISDLENGRSKSLGGVYLLRVAEALGQSPEWFTGTPGNANEPSIHSAEEHELLRMFRKLTLRERKIVLRTVRALVIDK